jgi:hypothetical protein
MTLLDMAEFEAKWQQAPVEPHRTVAPSSFYTYTAIPDEVIRNADVSDAAFRVFVIILSHAWERPQDMPPMEWLAQDFGGSVATFRKYLKELEEGGYVVVTRRGMGQTNLYMFPRGLLAPPETGRTKKPIG